MARCSRTVSAMRNSHIPLAQCNRLSIGGDEVILNLVAYMHGGTILDIVRDAMNIWLVVMTIPLGVGALTFHRYVQRALI